MEKKKVFSLDECHKTLRAIKKDISSGQLNLDLSNDSLVTSGLGAKYGVEVTQNGHASFEVDLVEDRKSPSDNLQTKEFIPFKGIMGITLQSFHSSNYLITADCLSADNPKLRKKGLKFSFADHNDLIALISLAKEKMAVSVNVEREKDPGIELYRILNSQSLKTAQAFDIIK